MLNSCSITAIAFLIVEESIDDLSSDLTKTVANKVSTLLTDTCTSLISSRTFLEANIIQQATTTIDLKNLTSSHSDTVSTLSKTASKLDNLLATTKSNISSSKSSLADMATTLNAIATRLTDTTPLASILTSNGHLYPHNHSNQVIPTISLATTTPKLSILLAPNNDSLALPTPYSLTANSKLCNVVNKHLNNLDLDTQEFMLEDDRAVKPATTIRGIQYFKCGAFLLDMDSSESANCLKTYATKPGSTLITTTFGKSALFKPKGYNLIFKFVPCTGNFDPSDKAHLSSIEMNNNIELGSILLASWIKQPDHRATNQTLASLKVICLSPESANCLLQDRTYISGHLITVTKDLCKPICCNKCQLFGHFHITCKSQETCAHCTSKSHSTDKCPPNQPSCCISCGPSSHHSSYYRKCPAFTTNCGAIDTRYPENNMPYFLTDKPWTWALAPPKLSVTPPVHQPCVEHQLPPHPQDKAISSQGTPHCQTTLNNFINQLIAQSIIQATSSTPITPPQ